MISVMNPFNSDAPQGIILYQGPSKINGKPIVVIATGFKNKTENRKTGNTIQTFILPAKENPCTTWKKGQDCVVCGNCKHSSPKNGGWNTCYVNIFEAPWNVWEAWKKGRYAKPTKMNLNLFRDRVVRIGSYGDPLSIPVEVWETIGNYARGWTGYTHLWRKNKENRYKRFLMASCDTLEEYDLAKKMGWRTFRVKTNSDIIQKDEFVCPASEEMGGRTTCEKCQMCCGLKNQNNLSVMKNVCISIHGRTWKIERFRKIMRLRKNKKAYRHLIPV